MAKDKVSKKKTAPAKKPRNPPRTGRAKKEAATPPSEPALKYGGGAIRKRP
jgi:hypothetical protein